MLNDTAITSTRPYLLRALHEWCSDNGLTPYLAVQVDASVQVPMAFVQDGHIVLNVSYDATSALHMGNDYISFKARFGGKPHDIMLPVGAGGGDLRPGDRAGHVLSGGRCPAGNCVAGRRAGSFPQWGGCRQSSGARGAAGAHGFRGRCRGRRARASTCAAGRERIGQTARVQARQVRQPSRAGFFA